MEISIECQKRPEGSKPRALRREGMLPANLYGHSGAESISLIVPTKQALNLLKKASINNTLVDLNVPELSWNGKVLIREVQTHPWKRTLHHISFFCPSGDNDVEVVVPLKIVGHSIGISKGGILEQMVTQVNVRCSPTNIPEFLNMDITELDITHSFKVSNLVLAEGIKVEDDPKKIILNIVPPKKTE